VCTTFRKRDNRVAEMRMGSMSVTPEYACDKEYFNNSLPFHTIVGKCKTIKNSNKLGLSCAKPGSTGLA
jgi:hypothetical protein